MSAGENNKGRYTNEPVIEVRAVSKSYGFRLVLKDVDIEIGCSQGLCICGVNGAGKSTLLRIIAGLLKPDNGTVKLFGQDIYSEPEKARPQLGMISHKTMLYPELTVEENLLFFARLYHLGDCFSDIDKLLEELGLGPYRYERASTLSRGMLQRLAIARALVHRPGVLLADEPFTGLDQGATKHLVTVFKRFRTDGGTLLMTSHDTKSALNCCDRVVVLHNKGVVLDAPTDEIDVALFAEDYLSYARSRT